MRPFCLRFLTCSWILFVISQAFGQAVIVSDDTAYQESGPHTLLELHAKDHNKGLLIPRMSTGDRLSLQPEMQETGLLVFDTTEQRFWFWQLGQWQVIPVGEHPFNTGGGGLVGFIQVADYGILPGTQMDLSDTLNALLAAHPGATFLFPDGAYRARLTLQQPASLISPGGQTIFTTDEAGQPALEVQAAVSLEGLSWIHEDSSAGSYGLFNHGQDIRMKNCRFQGYEHHIAPQMSQTEAEDCEFTTTFESIGSICWSPQARFTRCRFDGVVGADVMDSQFFDCEFEGRWGIHMPDGKINNQGDSTGYEGNARLYQCTIKGSFYYAIGLGNHAHPKLYHCVVIGHASGAYARTASTFEAYHCYIACTKPAGGASALKFAKYITSDKAAIGLQDEGDSYFFACQFENLGSPTGFQMIVPNKSDAGQAYFQNCFYSIDRICTEDTASICQGDVYRYIVPGTGPEEPPYQSLSLNPDEVVSPPYSPGGLTYLDLIGNGSAVGGIKFSKTYGSNREFPLGYRLVVRCGSNSQSVTLKNGYVPALGVALFTASGQDLKLGENEVAIFEYANNMWVQTSPNQAIFGDGNGNLALNGHLSLAQGSTVSGFSNDPMLATNSPDLVPTEQAVKSYVDQYLLRAEEENIQQDGPLSFVIPAGYRIRSLVLAESAGQSPAPVSLGTSPGGGEILLNYVLVANAVEDCVPMTRLFSLSQDQALYLSSTNWNSASVAIYVNLEKVK